MKKSLFTLLLMLLSVIALNAQSLTGKRWGTKLIAEDGAEVLVVLIFDKNGTCEMEIGCGQQIEEDGVPIDLMGYVSVPGTYSHNGDDLKMDFNRGKAEVDFDYEIMRPVGNHSNRMDAKTKSKMDKQIRSQINGLKGEFKDLMLNGMPKMHNTKIVSLDKKKLVIKDDKGDEIPFYSY